MLILTSQPCRYDLNQLMKETGSTHRTREVGLVVLGLKRELHR